MSARPEDIQARLKRKQLSDSEEQAKKVDDDVVECLSGTLELTFVDGGRNPLPGVLARVRPNRARGKGDNREKRSGNDGVVRFDLLEGSYDATFSLDGYVPVSNSYDVAPNEISAYEITLRRSLIVVRVMDGARHAMDATTITATRTGGQPIQPSRRAGLGVYRFPDVPAGTYSIAVRKTGYIRMTYPATVVLGETAEVKVVLPLRVLVVSVTNSAGQAITNATVSATGAAVHAPNPRRGGSYEFRDIPQATYRVSVAAANLITDAQDRVVADGVTRHPVTLYRSIVVVTVKTTGGAALPATMVAIDVNSNAQVAPSVSDDTGAVYRFHDLPAGTYHINSDAPNYVPWGVNAAAVGDGLQTYDFVIPRSARLVVNVTDYRGLAVAGIAVTVTEGGNACNATAQTTTRFTYDNRIPGNYTIVAEADTYLGEERRLTIAEGVGQTASIILYHAVMTLAEFEALLLSVTRVAENNINGQIGGAPTRARCQELYDETSGTTNAMHYGTLKHDEAERLLAARMANRTLVDPYELAIEKSYVGGKNKTTREARAREWAGTIRPDVVIHNKNSATTIYRVYDFKFTCPATNVPQWGKSKHADYTGSTQDVAYTAILRPGRMRLVNPTHGFV